MLHDRVNLPQDQTQDAVAGLLASYAGASVVFSPIAGVLADKSSTRQLPFLLGLAALFLATFLLFVGSSMPVLIIARMLQGTSAAVVWTVGLALCMDTVCPANLGTTIGSIFGFISVGNFISPLLGGVLYKKAGYAGVFGIAFAIIAVDFFMRLLVIEKKVACRYYANDLNNAEDTDTISSCHTAVEEGPRVNDEETPLLDKDEDGRYKISENQSSFVQQIPILPCLRDPGLMTALLVSFVQALLFGSFDATIPIVAQEFFDFDSLKSGMLFLPIGVFDLVLGPVAGWAVDRYGTKLLSVGGYVYLTPVLILFRLTHAGGRSQIILFAALLSLSGVGLAIIGAPSLVEAGAVIQKFHEANPDYFGEAGPYAQLYGLSSMVFNAGLALGPGLAGELKQHIGYGNANLVLGIICFVTAVLCFVFIGGRPRLRGT